MSLTAHGPTDLIPAARKQADMERVEGPPYHLCPICGAHVLSTEMWHPIPDRIEPLPATIRLPSVMVFQGHPCGDRWTGSFTLYMPGVAIVWNDDVAPTDWSATVFDSSEKVWRNPR